MLVKKYEEAVHNGTHFKIKKPYISKAFFID